MARLRGYLLKATYEWLAEYDMTPYVLIDADHPDAQVPSQYIEDGKIVLDISVGAVQNLEITPGHIAFEATFSGQLCSIFAPVDAVLAMYSSQTTQGIYARETGIGMLVNEGQSEDDLDPSPQDTVASSSKLKFRLVK